MSVAVNVDALEWFADCGGRFALPSGRTKGQDAAGNPTFPTGWQNTPNSLVLAKAHAAKGNNVGLLTGKHSAGIVALDVDVEALAVVDSLGRYAQTAKIQRVNAANRGKLLYRVDFHVDSQSWKPEGERSPWSELLSDGRHALIPPSEYEGGSYILVDGDAGILSLTIDDLAFIWHKATEGRHGLPEPPPTKKPEQFVRDMHTSYDAAKDMVLDAWSTFDVFDHFGLATEVREEKDGQIRLLGNGGLLIKPNGEGWYSFDGGKGGGDSISAWAWHKHKTPAPAGKLYWDVLREMAEEKHLTLPDARAQVHTNGVNGTSKVGITTLPNDDVLEEPPWMASDQVEVYAPPLDSFDNYQRTDTAVDSDPTILDADKVIALIGQIAMFQGDARRAGMEALRVLIGNLPVDERAKLYPALTMLYDPYKQRERIDSFLATCALPSTGPRFQPFSLTELMSRPAKKWYVNPIFGPGDIGDAFGPPGSAKTYGVIDLIFCCCLGVEFAHRFEVDHPLNVAYCAGEGLGGLPARFAAAAQHYQVQELPGFTFFEVVPQLFDQESADSILRFIAEWKARQEAGTAPDLDLLAIDTQHSATVGADENSAQDMGKVLSLAKTAVRELGCAVLLIHHSNKAGTGERGSSAMRGAMDFMIEFKPVAGKFSINCEKLKDSAAWKPQTFSLVELGDSARVWWDEPQISDQVVNKQDQDVDALLGVLRKSKGTRYTANHLAEAIGIGGSKQIFKLLPKAMREDMHVQSGLKHPERDPSPSNPLVYWYGLKDSTDVDG